HGQTRHPMSPVGHQADISGKISLPRTSLWARPGLNPTSDRPRQCIPYGPHPGWRTSKASIGKPLSISSSRWPSELAWAHCCSGLAELALVLRVPLPPILPWSVVSMVGAATVLSYAIIADYFPVEIAARPYGALNFLRC